MINRVVLVGRLTRDPELRYTANGAAVASFTVAVNRQFTNSQGEREADFINCVIWRKAAENFSNFTHKGSLVGVDGRVQTRSYDNQQGNRVYVTEVVVENFSLLESRSESERRAANENSNGGNGFNNQNQQAPAQPSSNQNTQSPFSNNNQSNNNNNQNNNSGNNSNTNNQDPFADNSKPIDISDDDLPF
ncbi:single-stranded DNA-binding protein [Companilactobacillus sp.]|jgi:single-strand DNA-binding protein|uniref:single-stranded DNA-binding protein n=1 Tax=Companilactobacillus sp. TaxID=2767905 RepID=UPI0025C639CE|nr:single-stranded DNA-binding protein [Companilactobacillus sp.]MCH4009463.1 single-stranded DNA-binding protein [Companilactobacillus sp.]MCH4050358.1 single-stranded DNA-binding protein [Companilactobacillus sp.]MCH4077405.1 single-stranded DNA-binding protein [Companilactobacillus sp.]MCH4125981.1 single-stranded DNA-binding protein [Companilactobacillus sp.]MCI1311690.1 single-stranded DNA-binding protein [Companilactobacillus sp.]